MRKASWSWSVLGTILVCSEPPASPDPCCYGLNVSPSCGLGLTFFKASAWQRLLEGRRSVQYQKYGWCLPNANVLSSSWWVYREDLTLNLLIRTNYAKITLKPCLIDDNSGNSFKHR